MSAEINEVPSSTPDFRTEVAKKLAELMPEVVADGKIDLDSLRELLADDASTPPQRFGLFWPGKSEAIRAAQTPTTATLAPDRENSVDWDTTQNIFIEGDNLEVLKILQKHYYGKIKMIYIDPPYNTGKDFVYPDNYADPIGSYLEMTGQADSAGKLSTNSESDGRFHSNWLNMLYPRLKLAKSLLTDDGIVFVSIDHHEHATLKMLMNEVFGEQNFIADFVWLKGKEGGSDSRQLRSHFEFVVSYCRNAQSTTVIALDPKDISRQRTTLPEANLVAGIVSNPRKGEQFQLINLTKQKDYTVRIPLIDGTFIESPSYAPQARIDKWIMEGKIFVGEKRVAYVKSYLADELQGQKPSNILESNIAGTTKSGSIEIRKLLGSKDVFPYPKPTKLMRRLLQIGARSESLVLDLFAGSASLSHAAMQMNAEDHGSRKVISVQLPEATEEDSEARGQGYRTISDISAARMREAASAVRSGSTTTDGSSRASQDLGFRFYRLIDTNFAKWSLTSDISTDELQQQLDLRADSSDDASLPEWKLTEVLLKLGLSLTEKIEPVTIEGLEVFSVADGLVLAHTDERVKPTLDQLRALVAARPEKLIVLEDAFGGNDELKTNLVQECRAHNVDLFTA